MIEDDLIRHQIYLQRRGAGIYNSILPELKAMRDKITARITNATPNELLKIKGMLKDLNSIIDGSFERIQPSLFKDFEELAVYEGQHALKMLDANTAAAVTIGAGVNDAALIAMVGKSKMYLGDDKGQTIDDLITKFSDRYKKDIKSEIELGLLAGDTTNSIVKRIQELSNGRTREQAKAMVLTIANHVGHQARSEVWEPYSDLFEGEEFNATLDGRTTLQCASLDLKVFPIGKGPQPPLHYRCRSIRVIKVKAEYSLGIDTTRSSMNGPVSSKLTYSGWLKGQSKEVQNEVLGVERAKLFRSGKITLDRFVDDKGKMYSLAQLKKADVIGMVKAVPKIDNVRLFKSENYSDAISNIKKTIKVSNITIPKNISVDFVDGMTHGLNDVLGAYKNNGVIDYIKTAKSGAQASYYAPDRFDVTSGFAIGDIKSGYDKTMKYRDMTLYRLKRSNANIVREFVSNIADNEFDYARITFRHEAWHKIDNDNGLSSIFYSKLKENGYIKDKLENIASSVSWYSDKGGIDEFFAEVGALYSTDKKLIDESLLKIFEDTISGVIK